MQCKICKGHTAVTRCVEMFANPFFENRYKYTCCFSLYFLKKLKELYYILYYNLSLVKKNCVDKANLKKDEAHQYSVFPHWSETTD